MIKQIAIAILLGTIVMQAITHDGNTVEKSGAVQMQELYQEDDPDIKVLPATEEVRDYQESLAARKEDKQGRELSEEEQEKAFQKQVKKLENNNKNLTWPKRVETKCWVQLKRVKKTKIYSLRADGEYDRIILYLHGGAYVYNMSKKHIVFGEELVEAANAKVVLPMYKLAPQSSYKEAYSMLTELYQELLKEEKEITIMGDSAGGGLALGFVEELNQKGIRIPDKMVLISPWVDITLSNPKIEEYEAYDLKLNAEKAAGFGELWANGTDLKDYHVSPLYGNLENLPRTLMTLGTEEILVPDNMMLYDKIKEGGNYIRLLLGEGMYHNYPLLGLDNSILARRVIEAFIRM